MNLWICAFRSFLHLCCDINWSFSISENDTYSWIHSFRVFLFACSIQVDNSSLQSDPNTYSVQPHPNTCTSIHVEPVHVVLPLNSMKLWYTVVLLADIQDERNSHSSRYLKSSKSLKLKRSLTFRLLCYSIVVETSVIFSISGFCRIRNTLMDVTTANREFHFASEIHIVYSYSYWKHYVSNSFDNAEDWISKTHKSCIPK